MAGNVIIAGLDPFDGDVATLRLATVLARLAGAEVVAVAACAPADAAAEECARRELGTAVLAAGAELVVAHGSAAGVVIQDVAAARGAALVVVGATRRGALGRVAPGTTAGRLLAGAPWPVAVAPPALRADWALRCVGAGFVEAEEGHDALRAAVAVAAAAGARAAAMSAAPPIAWAAPLPDVTARRRARATATAWSAFDLALARLPGAADTARSVVLGDTGDALVGFSRRVDLLVCGSRGYSPERALTIGGVTHRLLREARCPLLLVPRGAGGAVERLAGDGALLAA